MDNGKGRRYIEILKKIIVITIASVTYGIGISSFLDKNNLVPGGVSGLSIIINRISGIETGTVIFFINIPILIVGIWKFGLKFILSTIYAILISSAIINIFSMLPAATDDILLAALGGGAMVSFSLAAIFKAGGTTGGMDIIVRLIKLKYKHLKTGGIFLMADITIVGLSILVFGNIDMALYSAITVITCSTLLDIALYGKDEAKLFYIILKSEAKETELVERLLRELEVGVTYLKGYGAYKNSEKKVIMCAIRKNQLPKAKEIVKEIDDSSFMIITSANEIIGEGYKSHYLKSL